MTSVATVDEAQRCVGQILPCRNATAQYMHFSRRPLEEIDFSTAEDYEQLDLFNNECLRHVRRMTKWILIIYIGSDLWVPMLAYNTEEECLATLARWEVIPPTHGTCLLGVIEPEKRKRKRRD